jgi:hypothetical protein
MVSLKHLVAHRRNLPSISASKGLSKGSNDVGASNTCNACTIASTVDKAPGPGALRSR